MSFTDTDCEDPAFIGHFNDFGDLLMTCHAPCEAFYCIVNLKTVSSVEFSSILSAMTGAFKNVRSFQVSCEVFLILFLSNLDSPMFAKMLCHI